MSENPQSESFLPKALPILTLAVCIFSIPSFAQISDNQADVNRLKRMKRMSDSLTIIQNYDMAWALFQDFVSIIYPLETKDSGQSSGDIAEAIAEIDKDLIFKPMPDVIHYEDEDVVYDYIPQPNERLIAQRLTCLNAAMPLTFNDRVYEFIDYFTVRRRDYTMRMLARKNIYFPLFEKYLAQYGLPDELKYLAIIESALNPRAVSRAGAGGLWQFMPSTGRMYGLKQNAFIDERFDPEKSTEAACKYLKSLYHFFEQDWELTLAAYNCGPGIVQRAIRRSGGKHNFWQIYNLLPKETRAYVPIFTAIVYAMNYAEEHNLIQDQPYFAIEYDIISINKYVPLRTIAERLNVCLEDLQELNPELKRGIVPGTPVWSYPLRIPADRMDYFADHYQTIIGTEKIPQQARYVAEMNRSAKKATVATHKVQRGESLSSIAQKYGVSISQLKKWNHLRSDRIQVGSYIRVSSTVIAGHNNKSTLTTSTTVVASNKPLSNDKVELTASTKQAAKTSTKSAENNSGVHIVGSGDTLWSIARRYNMSVEQLKKLNNMKSDKLSLGQRIIVK
ncbi:MAG: LysM peptidoglycan-binding domain-containing protein [Bernardetiaceae bacterium]|nr:LysM peptidoglycan-binding domain-containing protein [Bernardetiaceae bacterium]